MFLYNQFYIIVLIFSASSCCWKQGLNLQAYRIDYGNI